MRLFSPHEEHHSVHDIDYERLRSQGIRGLIFDLDNTLCPWRSPTLGAETRGLLKGLQERGFRICVLSNGDLRKRGGVSGELAELGIPVIFSAHKPLPFGFKRAQKLLGLGAEEVAVVGDQLFTDVLGGNLLGFYTILVFPCSSREHPWTRYVARSLERFLFKRKLT